jgi:hypothetical protein
MTEKKDGTAVDYCLYMGTSVLFRFHYLFAGRDLQILLYGEVYAFDIWLTPEAVVCCLFGIKS